MKLSKYFHYVKIDENVYAIFNSLLMDVFYVDKNKLNNIRNFKLDEEETTLLLDEGIYVKSELQDEMALQMIKEEQSKIHDEIHIMYFIVTSSCNLACKYCFIENTAFNNKEELFMDLNTAKIAVDKYVKHIKEKELEHGQIIFYGGEPLLNWNVIKNIVEYIETKDSKIDISMVTNATLLTEDKIEFLAEHNVEFGISIDGPKHVNDINRVYKNSSESVYDKVFAKFPSLKASGGKFGLSVTITEYFLDNQEEIISWFKKLNLNSIFYNLYHYSSKDENWENYYNRASEFLIWSYETLEKDNIYDGRLKRKLDSLLETKFKFADCAAVGGNQLTIKTNGDVCVCHGYLKTNKYIIGNIVTDEINDMLKHEEMNFWKKRSTIYNDECLDCESLFICGGGCPFQSEALFGSRPHIDKAFCIHTKKSLEWALKKSYGVVNEKKGG